ncbi:hypothetical protein FAZ19_09140 [Sphingobacterium alkalisoli]|uniref:DUF1292 domain-containing protein n=1 Tax=Sphingobacterium alkalisoli TaxID=1874115 RepID=A0A4U0H5L3_9SPHI|nr:hypothetical protein [Sphingobacterium alkalisoli]TJY67047.1 hypothetical protein FAZ19_09140 [Sphingobacterium alkalisoli]GGH12559.1 hypothetical protein GCM10011418_12200 [Sphingobacterium alkalisoli]
MEKRSHIIYTDSGEEILFEYAIADKDSNSFLITKIRKDGESIPDILINRPKDNDQPTFRTMEEGRETEISDENMPIMKFCRLVLAEELEQNS